MRVCSTRNATLADENWTLLEPENDCSTAAYEKDGAVLRNNKLTVKINDMQGWCRIEFLKDGNTILSSREESDPAMKYVHVEGDHYRIRVS